MPPKGEGAVWKGVHVWEKTAARTSRAKNGGCVPKEGRGENMIWGQD